MDLYLVFSVIIFLSTQVFGEQTLPSLLVTEEKAARVGSEVEFICKASGPTDYPLLWTKILSEDDTVRDELHNDLPDKRIQVQLGNSSSILILKIKDIRESDAGRYRCEIQHSVKVVADTKLTVEQPASIKDYSTQSVSVALGEDAKLECYASGIPAPKVYWRRENNEILPGGHSIFKGEVLLISNAREKDRGKYYCVAENGIGKSARREVRVEVKFGPKIEPSHAGYGQVLGRRVDIACTIYGHPNVSVFWYKEGKPIASGNNVRISNFQTEEAKVSTVLTVDAVAPSDYGVYTCRAENTYGSDEKSITLYDTTDLGVASYHDISGTNWSSPSLKVLLLSMAFWSAIL